MHIIFKNHATELAEKYTLLDLDTFRFPDGSLHTACCVIENIPIQELSQTESLKQLHENLMIEYSKKNWNYCEQAIEHLLGKWGGELDTFYDDLLKRIQRLKTLTLDQSWTTIIDKTE